jgi:TRAP-type C4-dicarboxylate transport system substrate-binding protein
MKKFLLLLFVIGLVFSVVFVGCSAKPEPTPTPTPAPTPEPAPEIIELTLATVWPPPNPEGPFSLEKAIANYPNKVEEMTNGRVKITVYPAGTLLSAKEMQDGVLGGIADMGCIAYFMNFASDYPLDSVFELVGTPWTTPEARKKVIDEMLSEFPQMQEELQGMKILSIADITAASLHFNVDKVVHVPTDIKGMKIGTVGPADVQIVERWGATAVPMPFPDYYMSLERNVVDGVLCGWGGIASLNMQEVTKTHTDGIGMPKKTNLLLMSPDTWNSLPPDIQQVFEELNDWQSSEVNKGYETGDLNSIEIVKAAGHTVYNVTDEEFKQWNATYKPDIDAWIAEREAQGLPAEDIYNRMINLAEQYK